MPEGNLQKEKKVRKLLGILIAVIMVLSLTAPAMAADVTTSVTVQSGAGGSPPVIKCKWESPDTADPNHEVPGTQLLPPCTYDGSVVLDFWAVVTDPEGLLNVGSVYADVFHPEGFPYEGGFKFQVELLPWLDALNDSVLSPAEINSAIAEIEAAAEAGLVTFNPAFTLEEIIEEFVEGSAWLWFGTYGMYYHQPAGLYDVDYYAFDIGTNNQSDLLENQFLYEPVTCCEFDFTAVDYGNVVVSSMKQIDGNLIFDDGIPTVRNLGNTWFHLEIRQDDMGFGMSQPGDNWNVEYDCRLGNALENAKVIFDPAYASGEAPSGPWTVVPGIVHLCNTWKLDFSIHVEKATGTEYSGLMELQCVYEDFTGFNIPHP
jgi:hypothetical protein